MKIEPKELNKLRKYFDLNNVSYEVVQWKENEYNLHVHLGYVKLSFLTSVGSYGGNQGLIEVYNFIDDPLGHLSSSSAIRIYEDAVQG